MAETMPFPCGPQKLLSLGGDNELMKQLAETQVRGPTTWTTLQNMTPNHLGLRCNALPEHQMALITSGCAPFSWPRASSPS